MKQHESFRYVSVIVSATSNCAKGSSFQLRIATPALRKVRLIVSNVF